MENLLCWLYFGSCSVSLLIPSLALGLSCFLQLETITVLSTTVIWSCGNIVLIIVSQFFVYFCVLKSAEDTFKCTASSQILGMVNTLEV